jgi:hypothetical protein
VRSNSQVGEQHVAVVVAVLPLWGSRHIRIHGHTAGRQVCEQDVEDEEVAVVAAVLALWDRYNRQPCWGAACSDLNSCVASQTGVSVCPDMASPQAKAGGFEGSYQASKAKSVRTNGSTLTLGRSPLHPPPNTYTNAQTHTS